MISFSQYRHSNLHCLIESLDTPYRLDDVTDHIHPDNIKRLTDDGWSDLKFYHCSDAPDQGFMIGCKDGMFEVHHQHIINGNEVNQKNVLIDRVPSKFVSTAFHLIDGKVSHGHSVRILASNEHANAYHRLASVIAKRRGYSADDIQDHPNGVYKFHIHPIPKKSGVGFSW